MFWTAQLRLGRGPVSILALLLGVGLLPASAANAAPTPVMAPSRSAGPVVAVSTAAGLSAALAAARPGTTIRLADGRYSGHFAASTPGTAKAPIRLTGGRAAILDGGGITGGYVLHLDRASYWRLDGFSVTNAGKAIVLDEVGHTALNNLYVHHTGAEAVLLRNYSRENVVSNSEVAYTGLRTPGYGEGVYVGLAKSNWGSSGQSRTGGAPDSSDRNQVVGNYIHDTSAENVDIKEGTTGGLVANNRFDSGGMSGANYADSWVDVAGNGWVVRDNTGTNPGGSLVDGFQTHVQLTGWARDNLFSGNVAAVNAGGYGFNIQTSGSGNKVTASNRVTGAARGVSNITLTP